MEPEKATSKPLLDTTMILLDKAQVTSCRSSNLFIILFDFFFLTMFFKSKINCRPGQTKSRARNDVR